MKTTGIFLGYACLFIMILFAACSAPTGALNEVYLYPKELWGEWIRMDTGNTWYIASNYITTSDSKDNITIQKQSGNVIKVTKTTSANTSIFYLYASRILNGSFSGSVAGMDNVRSIINSRAAVGGSGLGGINVTISNRKDKANEVKATTDDNGNFTAEGVIPGDSYEIIGNGFSIPVYPNNSGEDVGTVTVTDGANLITSIRPQATYTTSSEYYDMMRLYPGTDYKLKIVVENVGTGDCRAALYELKLPENLVIVSTNESSTAIPIDNTRGTLSTIEPGKSGEIYITVRCNGITDEYEHLNIGIETKDRSGKTWHDSVSLKFNEEKVNFRVFANKQVRGIVIVPNVKAYYFTTSYSNVTNIGNIHNATVQVPKYSDDYLIVFSGATANTESIFSLAVDGVPNSDFSAIYDFWDKFVTNTSEENVADIDAEETITAYLEKNEILYFRVSFK